MVVAGGLANPAHAFAARLDDAEPRVCSADVAEQARERGRAWHGVGVRAVAEVEADVS